MIIVWSYLVIFLVISCNSSTEMLRETDEHELFDFNFLSPRYIARAQGLKVEGIGT
jgi:hypothetical protein